MADQMTSRECVLTAFNHTEPDRVPAWLGASPAFRVKAIHTLDLPDDESLSRFVGDDFRRVYARYAGPDEYAPDVNLPPGVTYRMLPFTFRNSWFPFRTCTAPPAIAAARSRRSNRSRIASSPSPRSN